MCKKPDFLIFPVVAEHFMFFGYFAIFVGDFLLLDYGFINLYESASVVAKGRRKKV